MIQVDEEIRGEVARLLMEWAEEHPDPASPVITFRGRPLFPSDLVGAVEENEELGRAFLHSLGTSYETRSRRVRNQSLLSRDAATSLMAEFSMVDRVIRIGEVELDLFLAPIQEMIIENRTRQ